MLPGLVSGLSQGQVVREDEGEGLHLLRRLQEEAAQTAAWQPFYVQTQPISSPIH